MGIERRAAVNSEALHASLWAEAPHSTSILILKPLGHDPCGAEWCRADDPARDLPSHPTQNMSGGH